MDDHAFLLAFEHQHLPQFTHRDHIRMAWLYLRAYGWDEGVIHIRSGIQHFAAAHGATTKYHETITVFWLELTASELKKLSGESLVEQCNAVLESLNDASLALQYYSADLLFSEKARASFVEPDLKSWK